MNTCHAVAVQVITPKGVVVVRDPDVGRDPIYWKLPGGKSKEGESPQQTAARELREETGIIVVPDALHKVHEVKRHGHMFYVFQCRFTKTPSLEHRGNDGEEVTITDTKKLKDMHKANRLLPGHFEAMLFSHAS